MIREAIAAIAERRTDYFYDRTAVQHGVPLESATFKSNYNRLEYYKVYNTSEGGDSLVSTTWYYYTREWGISNVDIGSPTWIVTNQAGTPNYSAIRLGYAANDRAVSFVLGETWTWDDEHSHTLRFTSVMEVRDGKVDRWWDYLDFGGLFAAAPSWWVDHIAPGYK